MNIGRNKLLISLILAAATLVVYAPVVTFDFVRYDDPGYVYENSVVRAGLTADGVKWVLRNTIGGFWMPVTFVSHMLDVSLFGLRPAGHHLASLFIHLASVLVLFHLLCAMTGAVRRSALVAALFALHPLNVESVAWIAERKNVLCALFWFLATWSYVGWARRRSVAHYLLTVLLSALALMSKPMAVTFPFTLLLLDYWPLGRMESKVQDPESRVGLWRLVVEKLPLFAMSAAFSVLALRTQQAVGAVVPAGQLTAVQRLASVPANYVFCLLKTLWPSGLAPLYPRPLFPPAPSAALVHLAVLAAFSAAALMRGRDFPYAPVGWLWFLGTLVPMAGFVAVGYHRTADRFAYIPSVGLFVIAAWGLADAAASRPRWAGPAAGAALAAVLALAAVTGRQVLFWRNSRTLFERAVAVTRGNYVMHDNLGREYAMEGRLDDAIAQFAESVRIMPVYLDARANLALALYQGGREEEALDHLRESVALRPESGRLRCNLGMMLAEMGRFEEAEKELKEAIRREPYMGQAHYTLAVVLMRQGFPNGALPHAFVATQTLPDSPQAQALFEELRRRTGR